MPISLRSADGPSQAGGVWRLLVVDLRCAARPRLDGACHGSSRSVAHVRHDDRGARGARVVAGAARLPVRGETKPKYPQVGALCPECRARYTKVLGPAGRAIIHCSDDCPKEQSRIYGRDYYERSGNCSDNFHRALLPQDRVGKGGARDPDTQPPSVGEPVPGLCVTMPGLAKPGCGGMERIDSTALLAFNGARVCFRCQICGRNRWVVIAPTHDESAANMRYKQLDTYSRRDMVPDTLRTFA